MYRTLLLITASTLCILFSCKDKKEHGGAARASENPMVSELDATPDSAFLGKLVRYTDDSIYIEPRRSIRLKVYAYNEAMTAGRIKGTMSKGDWFSIYPDNKNREVITMINTSELSGKWIYDQKQQRGISFNDKGGMTSINPEKTCFREWKLLNGLLYIYYVDMQTSADDRHKYSVEEANIASLSRDHLTLQIFDKTLQCSRPSNKPLKFK